jgi:hypothetical protein
MSDGSINAQSETQIDIFVLHLAESVRFIVSSSVLQPAAIPPLPPPPSFLSSCPSFIPYNPPPPPGVALSFLSFLLTLFSPPRSLYQSPPPVLPSYHSISLHSHTHKSLFLYPSFTPSSKYSSIQLSPPPFLPTLPISLSPPPSTTIFDPPPACPLTPLDCPLTAFCPFVIPRYLFTLNLYSSPPPVPITLPPLAVLV